MKKLLVLAGAVIFCLLISKLSFAEAVGNTADINFPAGKGIYSSQLSDFIKLNIGLDTDILIEKKFKYDSAVTTGAPKLEGQYYTAKLSCTLFDRIQPYLKFGASNMEMDWNDANGDIKVKAKSSLAYAVGLKAYLWQFEGLGLKVFSSASLRSTKPRVKSISINGSNTSNITESRFDVLDRQAAIGISREFKIPGFESVSLVPYIGAAYSSTTARVRVKQGTNVMNSGAEGQKDNWGLFLGTDFMVMDNLSLNVEGRFIDEKAVNLGFSALF